MEKLYAQTNSIQALTSLKTVEEISALNALDIYSLRDLAEFTPCRYAEILVGGLNNGNISALVLDEYLTEDISEDEYATVDEKDISSILGVSDEMISTFNDHFDISTIGELATFDAFLEAKKLIAYEVGKIFYEKPSAPEELMPSMIGSTHAQFRFSNYIKEAEHLFKATSLEFYSDQDEPNPESDMIEAFYRARFKFHLGYLCSIKQKWINAGSHLGEIVHSLALAPGESRNIAFIEWYSRQRSSRVEDTEVSEELTSEFFQNRALNEVVTTTAQEHLVGMTEIDATTKTSGFGITGGYGKTHSSGASASADLSSIVGFPLGVSGAVNDSSAGSIGSSYVMSKGTTQGVLQSETSGERTVTGNVIQNIADSTIQNSSNIRSLMSTVVVEDEQSGGQSAQTRNITNYNHSHALTIQYYEVLQKYITQTHADDLIPVLYLPFKPIDFSIDLITKYWVILKEGMEFKLPKPKIKQFDQLVKDYEPTNGAFDYSGDVRVTKVKINRSRTYSAGVRVELYDANPVVTLKVTGSDMDDCLDFKMSGSSTYIDYEFLDDSYLEMSSFGSVDSFEIDENIKAKIKSNFKKELKSQLKWYLDKNSGKTKKQVDFDKEDNELGPTSNRNNLKQDVEDDKYSLLNGDETISFTLDLEYELEDSAGNTTTVSQTYSDSLKFNALHSGYNQEVFNVTDHINNQLSSVTDVNSLVDMEDLESHFNTYKYFYTKYLLSYTEKEQIIDLIEHLGITAPTYTIPLTQIIDPNPLGIVENLMIFKLKKSSTTFQDTFGDKYPFSAKLRQKGGKDTQTVYGQAMQREVMRKGKKYTEYTLRTEKVSPIGAKKESETSHEITFLVENGKSKNVEGEMVSKSTERRVIHTNKTGIRGKINKRENDNLILEYELARPETTGKNKKEKPKYELEVNFESVKPIDIDSVPEVVNEYFDDLDNLEEELKKDIQKSTVFLPTRGVFGEAVLGRANASEYINIHRFFNWQDSPIPHMAPTISDVNVNQDYSSEISSSVNPNVPVSVLNQISPQQMPGTSLGTALQAIQNGNMFRDMSKTESLVSAMSDLATLANNTAQLAGTLSGEAAANALNAAVELGKKVASMVNKAMETNTAPPPSNPTAQGAAAEVLDQTPVAPDGTVSPTDKAKAAGMGTPIPEPPSEDPDPPTEDTNNQIDQPQVFEFATDGDLAYTSPPGLGTILQTLLPEEADPTGLSEYFGELAEPILNRFQYGGNLIFNGRVKLSEDGESSNRSYHMYGNTLALEGTTVSGLVSDWRVVNLLNEINDLAEMNAARVELALIAGDLSEIIALLTEAESYLDSMIAKINEWKEMTDASGLPEPLKSWVESNTVYQNLQSFLNYCQEILNAINEFKNILQNDLQAAGLFVKIEGFTNWFMIPYFNRTIGTTFITTIGTANKAQMDLRAE